MSDPNWPPPSPPPYAAAVRPDVTGERASWGSRVGASVIDFVLIVAVAVVLALPATASGDAVAGVAGIVIYAVAFLYAPLTMMRDGERNGQTFGKQAVGIRVVRDTQAPIGFWYSLLRESLVKGLVGTFTLGIDYLWPLWDGERQALHDKMVGAFVVHAR